MIEPCLESLAETMPPVKDSQLDWGGFDRGWDLGYNEWRLEGLRSMDVTVDAGSLFWLMVGVIIIVLWTASTKSGVSRLSDRSGHDKSYYERHPEAKEEDQPLSPGCATISVLFLFWLWAWFNRLLSIWWGLAIIGLCFLGATVKWARDYWGR